MLTTRTLMATAVLVAILCVGSMVWQSRLMERCTLEGGGRFHVVSGGAAMYLLDATDGKTWILSQESHGAPVWFPLTSTKKNADGIPWKGAFQWFSAQDERMRTVQISTLQSFFEREGYQRIKFYQARSGYLRVECIINKTPLQLILDTGAPNTHLDRSRTKRLGLKWELEDDGKFRSAVESVELGALRMGRLRVGEHDLSETNKSVELYGDLPYDGVLGADVLIPASAVIDYKNRDLYIMERN